MKPLQVRVTDIKFRRPGYTKISFSAEYVGYTRRGTVMYDTNEKNFITHTKDIALLAALCTNLQWSEYRKVG